MMKKGIKSIIATVVLLGAFSLSKLHADVRLMPKDYFNKHYASNSSYLFQPQVGYYADTWEDVYEKTGVSKYGWIDEGSNYIGEATGHQFFVLLKGLVKGYRTGWICLEYPGDDSVTGYSFNIY